MPQQLEKQRVDRRVELATRGPSATPSLTAEESAGIWKKLVCSACVLTFDWVSTPIVGEENQNSAFELRHGAPGPRALPQKSSGGPPVGLKRKGVKKSLPFTSQLACLLGVWFVEMSMG